jgi:hypothetical protein
MLPPRRSLALACLFQPRQQQQPQQRHQQPAQQPTQQSVQQPSATLNRRQPTSAASTSASDRGNTSISGGR